MEQMHTIHTTTKCFFTSQFKIFYCLERLFKKKIHIAFFDISLKVLYVLQLTKAYFELVRLFNYLQSNLKLI